MNRTGVLWLDESYDRYIRDEKDFFEKYSYIQNNPLKEGLVEDFWKYPFLFLEHHHRLEACATNIKKIVLEEPSNGEKQVQDWVGQASSLSSKYVDFEIIEVAKAKDVGNGTVARGSATCPCCGLLFILSVGQGNTGRMPVPPKDTLKKM